MPMAQAASTEKAGDIKMCAANSIPQGWLKANGAAVSRTAYAALFAVVDVTYGVGDGATTFDLPDLRGEFVRGLDDGRGVDAARAIGSAQADEIKAHSHPSGDSVQMSGSFAAGQAMAHANASSSTGNTGGAETRPRNIAMLACIKY